MVLTSPGVEVTIIDESNYVPAIQGTIPLVIVTTAQDKTSGSGTGVAAATTAADAGTIHLISSQRDLVTKFGNPLFYQTTTGTPIHGYELNEYGLMAAYSLLGASNRCYVVRADVDLAELAATGSRPAGNPAGGTYWLDTADTRWGFQEWNQTTGVFTNKVPLVLTDVNDVTGSVPKTSVGQVGSYAVVATSINNPLYYKNSANAWALVGSATWQQSWPAVQGTVANPTLTNSDSIDINTTTVTLVGTTVAALASDINTAAITGVSAAAVGGRLEIYVTAASQSNGAVTDGIMDLQTNTGTILADAGFTAGTFASPALQFSGHTSVPAWRTTDTTPRPSGSIWSKTTSINLGSNFDVSLFSSASGSFGSIATPLYANDQTAIFNLDSTGGQAIAVGTLFMQYDVNEDVSATYKLFRQAFAGDLVVTGTVAAPTFVASDAFTIQASVPGSSTLSTAATVVMSGATAETFATDVNGAAIANVEASVAASGAVVITHTRGGVLVLLETVNNPLDDAGITTAVASGVVRSGNNSDLIASNWIAPTYTASATTPSADPVDNTYWYDSTLEADFMVHDGSAWRGYNFGVDARGYDLSLTDPAGPILSVSTPTVQSDLSALEHGDIWIDTSDLDNYPVIYRWESVNAESVWVLLDNADGTTEAGIIFADARWTVDATTDVVTGDKATIVELLASDYVDLDRPDPALYPRGILMFNTRRSGLSVKQFRDEYFSRTNFPDTGLYPTLPTEKDAWVSNSGNREDGSPFMGRKAQRNIVVEAVKASITSNTELREEQRNYNLLSAPGYPEAIAQLVELNNDRRNTGFVIGDTPFRVSPDSAQNWVTNANLATDNSEDGIVTFSEYLGVFYPSGSTNDLAGNTIVVPPSHMMLRTIISSDNKSFPWFAPAGTRRGVVDNVNSIGYIDATTGEFKTIGVREGLRDTLYSNEVNPITFIPGTGIVNYGNKTRANTPSAMDRINVARLITFVRSQLQTIAQGYVFEPNDEITRNEIKQQIEQLLNDIVAKRGIFDYLVVCDNSNNTADRIDRNELYVDIAIEPVKAAEFIFIPVRIKNTGEIASGNVATSLQV